jgi:DNA-binding transcriptional LysR family regulator
MRRFEASVKQMIVIHVITAMNITGVNLNLLVSFDALMTERHVTRAARRMGLTQSAMSNALAQLRGVFDDPLLVRGPRGMAPTDRALQLIGPIREGLSHLEAALVSSGGFDPTTSERTFVVAASDYVEYVLLPPLLARLGEQAPRVSVEVRPWGLHQVPDGLKDGAMDLMIGYYNEVPRGHHQALLFEESYVCIARKGHPRVGPRLTLKRYLELSHVLVSQTGGSPGSVDRALAKLGKSRTVGLRVSHFLMVPMVVARTDMIAALSRRVAEPFAELLPLLLVEPPLPLPKGMVGQVWHNRTDQDPAHAWFRRLIAEIARTL